MIIFLFRPLSAVYGWLTDVRNWLFKTGISKSHRAAQYTISVGNLAVGGTGKTPMVEYLIRHLTQAVTNLPNPAIATLSRGYGRQTRGFRIAQPIDTAQTLGDEPAQLYRKFGPVVTVCVGEDRVAALAQLRQQQPDIQTVILDDAFQHRRLGPDLNLLLTDYARPFWRDHPFPAGLLRERRHGASRAQAVIVTKCPDELSHEEQHQMTEAVQPDAGPVPVFFTGLRYGEPVCFADAARPENNPLTGPVVLVSGLANATTLEKYVRQAFGCANHLAYGDHHAYTPDDLARILRQTPPETAILTTEKDWVKLDPLVTGSDRSRFFYLPVAVYFLDREAEFLGLIL